MKLSSDCVLPTAISQYQRTEVAYTIDPQQLELEANTFKQSQEAQKQIYFGIEQKLLQPQDALENLLSDVAQSYYSLIIMIDLISGALHHDVTLGFDHMELQMLQFNRILKQATELQHKYRDLEKDLAESSDYEQQNKFQQVRKVLQLNGLILTKDFKIRTNLEELALATKTGLYELYHLDWERREIQAAQITKIAQELEKVAEDALLKTNEIRDNLIRQKEALGSDEEVRQEKLLEFIKNEINAVEKVEKVQINWQEAPVRDDRIKQKSHAELQLKTSITLATASKSISDIIVPSEKEVQQFITQSRLSYLQKQLVNNENQFSAEIKDYDAKLVQPLQKIFDLIDRLDKCIEKDDVEDACQCVELCESIPDPQEIKIKGGRSNQTLLQLLQNEFLLRNVPDAIEVSKSIEMLDIHQLSIDIQTLKDLDLTVQQLKKDKLLKYEKESDDLEYYNSQQVQKYIVFDNHVAHLQKKLIDDIQHQKTKIEQKNNEITSKRQLDKMFSGQLKCNEIIVLEKEMFCPICLLKPVVKMLSCGHFYCDDCVNQMKEKGKRNQKCYQCQQPFQYDLRMMKIGLGK